jgi:hypothetical protein
VFLGLLAVAWFTSSAREKGRATVTTPAFSDEEGKATQTPFISKGYAAKSLPLDHTWSTVHFFGV